MTILLPMQYTWVEINITSHMKHGQAGTILTMKQNMLISILADTT